MVDITRTRSDEFFRLLVESVRDYAIFALDAGGRVASWNTGAQRIKGYTEAEILGAPYAIFFTPEDVARGKPQRLLSTAIRDGRVEDEGWRVRKDGTRFWADAVLTALRDSTGRLVGFAKVTRDLTDRRMAEIQARELLREQAARENAETAARRMEMLARASAAVASSFDYEGTLREAVRLTVPGLADFCAVDLIEGNSLRRVAVAHRDPERQELAAAMGAGQLDLAPAWRSLVTRHVAEVTQPPQETAPENPYGILRLLGVRTAVLAPLSTHGRLFGTLVFGLTEPDRVFEPADVTLAEDLARRFATAIENAGLLRDVETGRGKLEEQAQELEVQTRDLRRLTADLATKVQEAEAARAVAEEANRAKSRFLATMSHELRTPLNAIAGHADLLALGIHGSLTDAQKQALLRIQRNEQRLLTLINDIISFAKLEAGQLRFQRQSITVQDLLTDIQELVHGPAEAKGIDYQRQPVDPELRVVADPEKAARILLNLVDNAVKFTDRGGEITIGATAEGAIVRIFVRDNGRGIPPNRLGSIFEPFVQVDQEHTRDKEGLGLGLAISRELARNMDGDIEVQSELGRGSTFTLILPRSHSVEAAA